MEIVSIEYAVEVGDKVHWFTGFVAATYFASDNKTDVIEKVEYDNGDKKYTNLRTKESKVF